jgi:hypothetical protein
VTAEGIPAFGCFLLDLQERISYAPLPNTLTALIKWRCSMGENDLHPGHTEGYTLNAIGKWVAPVLLTGSAVLLSIYFSGGFTTGPLFAGGDAAQWEFLGHYFHKNISIFPLPRIALHTDQIFYPYGVNAVLEPWAIEREYFFTVFFSLFGTGPWLYIYYMSSLVVTCLGLYLLFHRDFGRAKAFLAGLVAVFFNFYALAKFPGHFPISVVHWTVLSIAVDFLLMRRITAQQEIPLRLILLRALLTVLALGQDLGYSAGSSLLSLTVCMVYAILFSIGYYLIKRIAPYRPQTVLKQWKEEFRQHRAAFIVLLLSTIVFLYLYVPIVVQIYLAASDFVGIPQGAWWSSPWRLLIPRLPWINPTENVPDWFSSLMRDNPEGFGAGSPGLFLIAAAGAGIFFSRRRAALIPFIILFFWISTNHPYTGFSLTTLPWFKYARVGSRFTMLMAPLLTILALSIPLARFKTSNWIKVFFVLLTLTGILEFYDFFKGFNYRARPLPENFSVYMETVKHTPGEAVLDWPFCIAGGNGVGTDYLGRFYHRNNAVGFMQRYHEKKIVGNYFGRLSMKQIEPFLRAGWNKMFHPDDPNPFKARRQAIPMSTAEWEFLDSFFTLNDFCGMNLYTDLLAPGDEQRFYERFGNHRISTEVPSRLRTVFIPKDPSRRAKVDRAAGSEVDYLPAITSGTTYNLVAPKLPSEISFTGIFPLVKGNIGTVRLAGNGTELFFKSDGDLKGEVLLVCYVKQPATMLINHVPRAIRRDFSGRAEFAIQKGINRVKIVTEGDAVPTIAFKEFTLKIQ